MTDRFEAHALAWRDASEVISQWAHEVDESQFEVIEHGKFWDILSALDCTLIVSREYEHLVLAFSVCEGERRLSYLSLPHPAGIAFNRRSRTLHIASTRNPNQVIDFLPAAGGFARGDSPEADVSMRPFVPIASKFYPGCFYIHDLGLIGGRLHANSVGQNAIVLLEPEPSIVWWPKSLDAQGERRTQRNAIQLNSIAAGATLEASYFSASGESSELVPPGHPSYPVDGRGVIFSGATREPVVRGLTRPHSARLFEDRIWVDNSGYGTVLAFDRRGEGERTISLPGWTRGLAFEQRVGFAGTSRVIPRFRQYAPGLDVDRSVCGLHAFDPDTGSVLASLEFPTGNQIFAIEVVPGAISRGFPFVAMARDRDRETELFYAFRC